MAGETRPVEGTSSATIDFTRKIVEKDGEYRIDTDGVAGFSAGDKKVDDKMQEAFKALAAAQIAVAGYTLDEVLKSIDPSNSANLTGDNAARLAKLLTELEAVKNLLEGAKLDFGQNKITADQYNKLKADLTAKAEAMLTKANDLKAATSNQSDRFNIVKNALETLGVKIPADNSGSTTVQKSLKAGTDDRAPQTEQPQTQPPAGYTTGNQGAGLRAAGGAGGYNYGWNAGTAAQGGGFDLSAYWNSMAMDQSILNSQDGINKSQADQQKMMMLFFYFARMAASGDMAAMYRFMYFITTIIAKDKAAQNIGMASKLIDLENKNRESLKMLLDTPAPAANDQQAQARFTQVLQTVQAEQSSVATSQKLISQIMEEMGQVVESLTEATKAALDSNGRVSRIVSRNG